MMTKKVQKNSAILEAIYETASDLHSCGLLTDQRMHKYQTLCLKPISVSKIKHEKLNNEV